MEKFRERVFLAAFVMGVAALGVSLAAAWPVLSSHFSALMGTLALVIVMSVIWILDLYRKVHKARTIRAADLLLVGILVLMSWSIGVVILSEVAVR
jgi:hypothetical protein